MAAYGIQRGSELQHGRGGHFPGKQLLHPGDAGHGLVHVSGQHGGSDGPADPDRAERPGASQNAGSSGLPGGTVPGEILPAAGLCRGAAAALRRRVRPQRGRRLPAVCLFLPAPAPVRFAGNRAAVALLPAYAGPVLAAGRLVPDAGLRGGAGLCLHRPLGAADQHPRLVCLAALLPLLCAQVGVRQAGGASEHGPAGAATLAACCSRCRPLMPACGLPPLRPGREEVKRHERENLFRPCGFAEPAALGPPARPTVSLGAGIPGGGAADRRDRGPYDPAGRFHGPVLHQRKDARHFDPVLLRGRPAVRRLWRSGPADDAVSEIKEPGWSVQ